MKQLFLSLWLLVSLNIYAQTENPYIDDFNTTDEWTNVYGQANTGIHNGELCFNLVGSYLDDTYYSYESATLDLTLWDEVNVEFTTMSSVRNGDLFAFWYYDEATSSWSGYNIGGLYGTYTVTIPPTTSKISFDLDTYANGNTGGKYAHVDRIVLSNPFATLPVELILFEGENHGTENYITWITASELNCKDFNIERSTDGKIWNVIRTVGGSGTTSTMTEYEIVDRYFTPGINQYRLVQYDYNGQSETFNMISIDNTTLRKRVVKLLNTMGQEVPLFTKGVVIEVYEDGTSQQVYR